MTNSKCWKYGGIVFSIDAFAHHTEIVGGLIGSIINKVY